MRVLVNLFICFSRPLAGRAEEGTAALSKQSMEDAKEREERDRGGGSGLSTTVSQKVFTFFKNINKVQLRFDCISIKRSEPLYSQKISFYEIPGEI